jgi:hypothetical protein
MARKPAWTRVNERQSRRRDCAEFIALRKIRVGAAGEATKSPPQ